MLSFLFRRRSTDRRPAILFISGAGGHIEQARRVASHVDLGASFDPALVLLTDHELSDEPSFEAVYSVPSPAPKHRASTWRDAFAYTAGSLRFVLRVSRVYRFDAVIVTGPGFAFLPSVFFKLSGALLIVFESWSRFEHRSKCSRALYSLADYFFVQHKELLDMYPRAKWVGLL